jgi:hypothetical protein
LLSNRAGNRFCIFPKGNSFCEFVKEKEKRAL